MRRFAAISVATCVAATLAVCVLAGALPSAASAAGTASVSGTITRAGTGEGLKGVAVCVTEASAKKDSGDCTQSGAGGAYAVTGIAPGTYLVEFSAAGVAYVPSYYLESPSRATAQKLTLAGEQQRTGVNAALVPIQGAGVTGRVVSSKNETPIAGIQVCAWEELEEGALEGLSVESLEEFFALHCTNTEGDGEYVITHLRGAVIVEFSAPFESGLNFAPQDYPEASSPEGAEEVQTIAGQLTTGVSARLDEGGSITGTAREAGDRRSARGDRSVRVALVHDRVLPTDVREHGRRGDVHVDRAPQWHLRSRIRPHRSGIAVPGAAVLQRGLLDGNADARERQ